MFFSRSDIVEKVNDIIFDGHDNDIVFIIANKGIGKIKLLNEISDMEAIHEDIIIADGNRIRRSCSCLTKCYIDGICSYIEKQNMVERLISFIDLLPKPPHSDPITEQGELDVAKISSLLFKMPLSDLKDIYVQLASETPLVIFASAISLNPVDVDYLLSLKNDTWGAKITFFIALRPTPDCICTLELICKENEKRVWIFPLMPQITKESHSMYPTSVASISIGEIGNSNNFDFTESILSSNAYFDTYNLVEQILSFDFQPSHLFLLANQEMRVCDQKYLKTVVRRIYHTELPEYDKRLVLPHEGKLLWLDALSYYLTLYDGMQKAILATQSFFFDVIANADQFLYGMPERKACSLLLTEAAESKPNQLAEGFSSYFSNFAALSKALSIQKRRQHVTTEISDFALNILDRVVIDLTDSCMTAFPIIHEKTQICAILDIGLETIIQSLNNMAPTVKLKTSTEKGISTYQEKCLSIAYKWSDTTIVDGIVTLQKTLHQLGMENKFVFPDLKNPEKHYLYEYFEHRLIHENLQISNIVLPSYPLTTHNMNSKDIFSEETLCENLEKALITIQQNRTYDGLCEDPMNDILRDLLRMKYDHIRDQTRHGTSGTGDGIGRVDILLCDDSDLPYAVIEPLRLSSLDRRAFSDHIDKSIDNYNPTGCHLIFTVIYSFCKNFDEFWNKVFCFLKNYSYPFNESKSVCLIDISRTETRHAKIILSRSGKPFTLHVYAINLYKPRS